MARREFLRRVGRASAGAACAGALIPVAGCAGVGYAPSTVVDGALRVEAEAFGDSDAVLVDNPRDARPVFLRRVSRDEYTAVSTRCAHRGCQVERQGSRLACPCHGSEYGLDGALLEGPADRPLRRYPVRVRNGAVFIMLDAEEGAR